MAVTYDGEQVYGLEPKTALELEAHVPLATVAVGPGRSLAEVRERFAALAGSLGRGEPLSTARELDAAEDALRQATGGAVRPRVLALSPAGPGAGASGPAQLLARPAGARRDTASGCWSRPRAPG